MRWYTWDATFYVLAGILQELCVSVKQENLGLSGQIIDAWSTCIVYNLNSNMCKPLAFTHTPEWSSWRAVTCAFAKLMRGTDELQPCPQKAQADILAAIKASKGPTQKFTVEAWCALEG